MKAECPNCKSIEMKKVIHYNNGSDNIDKIGHYHLECQQCGNHFNLWEAPSEVIEKAFGASWKLYI
jgi:uncharacterized Zn finger protein